MSPQPQIRGQPAAKDKHGHLQISTHRNMAAPSLKYYFKTSYLERRVGSNGDFRTEVNITMGIANQQVGVTRGQGLNANPAAVALTRRKST